MEYLLAPLDGFTDCRYRQAFSDEVGGLSAAIAPFVVLVPGRKVRASHLRDLWPENNGGMMVEPQILGNEEAYFPTMVAALRDLGYTGLNWNLGCPIRSVAAKRRGAGLLSYPAQVDRFLDKAYASGDVGLSVKIRLGYRDRAEIWPLLEVLNRYPLRYVAIHPRTGIQGYGGRPDWDFLETVLPQVKAPVYYSGDIFTVADAQVFRQRFPGIQTILLGRGVLADPFLPRRLQGEEIDAASARRQCLALMVRLHDCQLAYGIRPQSVLKRLKPYWLRLDRTLFRIPEAWMNRMKTLQTMAEYEDLIKMYGIYGDI